MTLKDVDSIIRNQFLDIVTEILQPSPEKLRLILKDKSFIDIRLSCKIEGRFDFHWERRHIDNTIYRYDNFPDKTFNKFSTFPYHFHKKTDANAQNSPFSQKLPFAFIDFMNFIKKFYYKK